MQQPPGLQLILESNSSDRLLEQVALKKEIFNARKLFEVSAQNPSPSKDYTNILITEKGVVWRKWKITLRGVASGSAPTPMPIEEAMSYADFNYNDTLKDEVKRIFSEDKLQQIERILAGNYDDLSCLPDKVMLQICMALDLQSLMQLSQVNHHLRQVCNSDTLWKNLYFDHQGLPSDEVISLSMEIGWKKVFFMSKLQLQKELSRRRRVQSPTSGNAITKQSKSSTFVTES